MLNVDGDQRADVPTGSAWVLDPTLPTDAVPTVPTVPTTVPLGPIGPTMATMPTTQCSAHWAHYDHNAHYTLQPTHITVTTLCNCISQHFR